MKKSVRILILIFVALIGTLLINNTCKADTGPKPFIQINIDGKCDNCYLTLLSKTESTGPYNSVYIFPYLNEEEKEIDKKFSSYDDKDGFYYIHSIGDISEGEYKWSYFPPSTFKVLIYDKTNDKFITDDNIYETYAFGSYFTLKLNNDSFSMEKSYNYGKEIWTFLLRFSACLIIEIGIALLFRIYKQELFVVLGANVVTQLILNIWLNLYVYYHGLQYWIYFSYVLLEIFIFILETIIYYWGINKVAGKYNYKCHNLLKLLAYSFVANAVSFGVGFILVYFM